MNKSEYDNTMSNKTLLIDTIICLKRDNFSHPIWNLLVRDFVDSNSKTYRANIHFSADSLMCLLVKNQETESHIVSGFCTAIPQNCLTDSSEVLIPVQYSRDYDDPLIPPNSTYIPLSRSKILNSITPETVLQKGYYLSVEF